MSSTLSCQDMNKDTKEHQDAWRRIVIVEIAGRGILQSPTRSWLGAG